MYVEARALDRLEPKDEAAIAKALGRAERLQSLPQRRDRLWDDVVSKQKNVLWGTDEYQNIIAASDPASKVRDAVYGALARVDQAWGARLAPEAVAAKWAEARAKYLRLAAQINVRQQIATRRQQGQNALTDPGFEQGLEGWKTWVRPGTEMEVRLDETQAHAGKVSAYLGPGTIACYLQDVKVRAGDAFYVGCWARRATSNGVCALKVWWKKADGTDLGIAQWERRAADHPGEWQPLELYGEVPPGAGIAEVLLLGQDHEPGDGCWFDDIECYAMPAEGGG